MKKFILVGLLIAALTIGHVSSLLAEGKKTFDLETFGQTMVEGLLLGKNAKTYPNGEVPVGAIWEDLDAQIKCTLACAAVGGDWEGVWRVTKKGENAVCKCANIQGAVTVGNITHEEMMSEWPFKRSGKKRVYTGKIKLTGKKGAVYYGKNYTYYSMKNKSQAVVMDVKGSVEGKIVRFYGSNARFTKNPSKSKRYYPDNFICTKRIGYFDCYSYDGKNQTKNSPSANFSISKDASKTKVVSSGLVGKIADLQGEWVKTDYPTSSVIIKDKKIAFAYQGRKVDYAPFEIYDGCPEHDDSAGILQDGDTLYIKEFGECYGFYVKGDELGLEYQGAKLEHSTYRRKTSGKTYGKISNAAIKGHNDEKLSGVSVSDCIRACNDRQWCKSFDYYKNKAKCDLSSKSYKDVGLKQNYSGNPYDHYIKK